MEENQQTNTTNVEANNYNNYGQGTFNNKKRNNMIWVIPVALIIVLFGMCAVILFGQSSTKQIYKKVIASVFDAYEKQLNKKEFDTQENRVKLDVEIETEEELIEQELLDLINGLEIEMGVQVDKKNKQTVVDIRSEYEEKDVLDLKVFADIEDKKSYLYAKDFFDKYLEVELEDEIYDTLEEIYQSETLSFGKKINMKSAIKIIKKEFENVIKSEYCSNEKTTINVNNKDVKTTKNSLKMTLEQLANEFANVSGNLSRNKKFLNLFEDEHKEEIVDILEEWEEEFKEIAEEQEKSSIQLNVYTSGLFKNVIKSEILLIDEDENVILTIACTKLNDKNYSFELFVEDEKVINGTIEVKNKNSFGLKTEIEDLGSIEIDVEYTQQNNIDIDKIDENNTIKIEDITSDDENEIMQNLEDSELYEILEEYLGNSLDSDFTEDNDFTVDYSDDFFSGNTTTSSLQNNQVVSYDKKAIITVGIPNGYVAQRISDTYLALDKNDVSITVTSDYNSEAEYYESLKKTQTYMEQQSYYKNMRLSEKSSIAVGGRVFYKATSKYDYEYYDGDVETITTDYFWTKVSEDYVLEIEIEKPEQMTSAELEQLLTITVNNN